MDIGAKKNLRVFSRLFLTSALLFDVTERSWAADFLCTGKDNQNSTYAAKIRLTPTDQIDTNTGVLIRKTDLYGYQYDWSMLPKYSSFVENQTIHSQGPFKGGQLSIIASYQSSSSTYGGEMLSWGNLGDVIDIPISCVFQP